MAGLVSCAVLLGSTSAVFAESYFSPIQPQIIDANSDVTGLIITDEKPGCFASQNKLVPGDTIQGVYKIQNTSSHDAYQLYLYAESPSGSGAQAQDLIHRMTLTLTLDGKEVYNGTADGAKDSRGRTMLRPQGAVQAGTYLNLGTIIRGSSHTLKARFRLPGSLDNRYQNTTGSIRWVFYAEANDSSKTSSNPSRPDSSPTPAPSTPASNGTGSVPGGSPGTTSDTSSGSSGSGSTPASPDGPEPESGVDTSHGNGGGVSSDQSAGSSPSGSLPTGSHTGGSDSTPGSGGNNPLQTFFKTGDDAPIAAALAVFVSAEAVVVLLLRRRKKHS